MKGTGRRGPVRTASTAPATCGATKVGWPSRWRPTHSGPHWAAPWATPPWAARAAHETLLGRKAAESTIDTELGRWTAGFDQTELVELFQPSVPAAEVHDQSGLHLDPQVEHRGYFVPLEHSEIGLVDYDGLQAVLSRTLGRLRKPGPCVGEDSYLVLSEILGKDADEIADLLAVEAVETTGA